MKQEVKRVVIYSRISVDDPTQTENSSIENQENMARSQVDHLSKVTGIKHEVVAVLKDQGISGGHADRPAYQQLMTMMRRKMVDAVLAKEQSRISRNVRDYYEFLDLCREYNVDLYFRGVKVDTKSPMGEAMSLQAATFSQLERRLICQRTRDGIRSAMFHKSKIPGGPVALGFNADPNESGRWLPNDEELKSVVFIMQTFIETGSFKETLATAKKVGIKNKYGNELTYTSLKRLLTNRRYIGKLKVRYGEDYEKETEKPLPFGAVVPIELFEAVQKKVENHDSGRRNQNRLGRHIYPLTGLLFFEDGTHFLGSSGSSKTGDRHYYYVNKTHALSIDSNNLEAAVFKALKTTYEKNDELEAHLGQIKAQKLSRLDAISCQSQKLRHELKQVSNEEKKILENLKQIATQGNATKILALLDDQISQLEQRKKSLEMALFALDEEQKQLAATTEDVTVFRSRVAKIFDHLMKADPIRKRAFAREVFDKIEVFKTNQVKIFWKVSRFSGDSFNTGEQNVFPSVKWRE